MGLNLISSLFLFIFLDIDFHVFLSQMLVRSFCK